MKLKIELIGIIIAGLALWAPPASAKKLKVVASLPSLAAITQKIGGEHVEVSSITRGVQDAHYVEAKPSYMVALSKADLLVYSGMELEIGWLPLLIQGSRNSKIAAGSKGILNTSTAIPQDQILDKPRGEVDRSMGDVHPMGNPHFLLDPRNGILVAELIAEKLSQIDPPHQGDYANNLAKFKSELEPKIKEWEKTLAQFKGMEAISYHPHWSYLLNWLGIKCVGDIELKPGIPPTPRHIQEIQELMKARKVPLVITSSWKDPKPAEEVARTSGAKLAILPGEVQAMPGAEDYISWFDVISRQLVATLGPEQAQPGYGHGQQHRHRHGHHD